MSWIPGIIGGNVFKKIFDEDSVSQDTEDVKSTLDQNMLRLRDELKSSSAKTIAIIGQPGSGKSTLLRMLTRGRCTPLPIIGQKTDATAWHNNLSVNFFNNYQGIQFIDIPGYDTNDHPIDSYLKYFPFSNFDKLILVVNSKIHDSDIKVFNKIVEAGLSNVVVVRGHSDGLCDYEGVLEDFDKMFNIRRFNLELIFCSSKNKEGINRLANFCELD